MVYVSLEGVGGRGTSQTCKGWTASNANLYATCYTCLATFHLTCLDPPLSSKPSRGYAWNCKYD